jgi:hypothetical protein
MLAKTFERLMSAIIQMEASAQISDPTQEARDELRAAVTQARAERLVQPGHKEQASPGKTGIWQLHKTDVEKGETTQSHRTY